MTEASGLWFTNKTRHLLSPSLWCRLQKEMSTILWDLVSGRHNLLLSVSIHIMSAGFFFPHFPGVITDIKIYTLMTMVHHLQKALSSFFFFLRMYKFQLKVVCSDASTTLTGDYEWLRVLMPTTGSSSIVTWTS